MLAAAGAFVLLALPAAGAWRVAIVRLGDWRLGLGMAALGWATWAVLVTELLSLGAPHVVGDDAGQLTRWTLLLAWLFPALAGLGVLTRQRQAIGLELRATRTRARTWPRLELALLTGIGVCLAITLLVALVAAPNNWDSHVYHLARVATWEQLGGIAHYATSIDPQNYQPPGAEILIAQGYVLSGGDRLAALVQWFAYAGSIVIASSAAQALGAGRRGQLASAALVASTPLAILEASSTQNDLLLGFWLLLAATLATRLFAMASAFPALSALGASLALGIAVLTKGTALIFALPIGLLLAVAAYRRLGLRRTAPLAIAGVVLVALPSAGHWSRNHETYGSVIATTHAGIDNPYAVQNPDASTLAANLLRNATNHLDLPLDAWNDGVENAMRRAVTSVGADADDPRTTFLGQPFKVGPFGPHEDHAGSLLLLVLGIWAAASTIVAVLRGQPGSRPHVAWLGIVVSQVLLFCWLVTWQNWHVRMHLPITLLVAVLVAVRLEASRLRGALPGACLIALAMAPLYLLFNVTRPILGDDSILTRSRTSTSFQPRPQLQAPYREVVRRLSDAGVAEAGLATGIDDWQYALATLGADARPAVRFHEVLAEGASAKHADAGALPSGVVCVSCSDQARTQLAAAGLVSIPLDAGGPRPGRGDDVSTVELWLLDASP